jgi:hypothetical protein
VIGELTTVVPVYPEEFGSAQDEGVLDDIAKLRRSRAAFKYLFVTSAGAYRALRDNYYRRHLRGVRVVLLT